MRHGRGVLMKAIVQDRYGSPKDVLKLEDIDVPTCGEDRVLVRVVASSANPWDWHFIRGEPLVFRPMGLGGIRKPKFVVPGGDVAGIVEQVGNQVTEFAPGDPVYGFGHGAFAEYVAVSRSSLARKPANLTFAQAAAVPLGAVTALQGLRAGELSAGQHVLVIGASGGVGAFAVQIAKHLAAEVTGVCSTGNVDLVKRLGADHVVDYTKDDVTKGSPTYDFAFQLGGTYSPRGIRRVLKPQGTLIQSYGDGSRWVGPLGQILEARLLSLVVRQTLKSFTAEVTTEDLDEIRELIESGALTPIIDRTYELADAAQAVDLVESGRPPGKVIVSISGDAERIS